jgi:hypothetical protein
MTPKQKAAELILMYMAILVKKDLAKKCALAAVDQIIESRKEDKGFNDVLLSKASEYWTAHPMYLMYWQEVKQEIEKL